MAHWYFWLTPLAGLGVLLLFRFVGCDKVFGLESIDAPEPYDDTVSTESGLISYWRLQEDHGAEPPAPTAANTPVSGGTAKDEQGLNDGSYTKIIVEVSGQFPDSADAPGNLALEAPGLLDVGDSGTSLSVDGGYVEIPFSNSLLLTSFTIEVLVHPEWSSAETGLFRTVIAFTADGPMPQNISAFGFALYAGPQDPVARTGPDIWQIWVGNGTAIQQIQMNHGSLPLVDFTKTNYLAVTYDDSTQLLNLYTYVEGIQLDSGPFNPVQDVAVAYGQNADPTSKFLIGINQTPSGSAVPFYHPFKGRIQEVAVYDSALTYNRIISHIGSGLNL